MIITKRGIVFSVLLLIIFSGLVFAQDMADEFSEVFESSGSVKVENEMVTDYSTPTDVEGVKVSSSSSSGLGQKAEIIKNVTVRQKIPGEFWNISLDIPKNYSNNISKNLIANCTVLRSKVVNLTVCSSNISIDNQFMPIIFSYQEGSPKGSYAYFKSEGSLGNITGMGKITGTRSDWGIFSFLSFLSKKGNATRIEGDELNFNILSPRLNFNVGWNAKRIEIYNDTKMSYSKALLLAESKNQTLSCANNLCTFKNK